MYHSSRRPPFYLKRFVRGKRLERTAFYCDDLSQYVSAQMVLILIPIDQFQSLYC